MKTFYVLLLPIVLFAQGLQFYGNADVYFEYDSTEYDNRADIDTVEYMSGGYQVYHRPSTTGRFSLNPTLSYYNMPISANLVFSTNESESRQRLNIFQISLMPSLLDESVLVLKKDNIEIRKV